MSYFIFFFVMIIFRYFAIDVKARILNLASLYWWVIGSSLIDYSSYGKFLVLTSHTVPVQITVAFHHCFSMLYVAMSFDAILHLGGSICNSEIHQQRPL